MQMSIGTNLESSVALDTVCYMHSTRCPYPVSTACPEGGGARQHCCFGREIVLPDFFAVRRSEGGPDFSL